MAKLKLDQGQRVRRVCAAFFAHEAGSKDK